MAYKIKSGSADDDQACGLVRCAASRASGIAERLPGARQYLLADGPENLHDRCRLVAVTSGRIVGFVDFERSGDYVKMLYVEPEAQGQGIAGALLRRAVELLEIPARSLHLKTQSANEQALRFYLRQGFTVAGAALEDDWHGATVVWLNLEGKPAG